MALRNELPVTTFSLVACDPKNGDLGVAVASKFLAVGAVVPWARAGVGAVAAQAWRTRAMAHVDWICWRQASRRKRRSTR